MKSKLLSVALAIAFLPVCAQEHHAGNYSKSVFTNFHELKPSGRKDQSATLRKVEQHFPGMQTSIDKLSGNFTNIFGNAFAVAGNTIEDKIQVVFADHLGDFGIRSSEWVQTAHVSSPRAVFVNYEQKIDGRKVIFATIKFRFTLDGRLERISMKNYGAPDPSLTPVLTQAAAQQLALEDVHDIAVSESSVSDDWFWFPVPSIGGYDLRPAFAFNIKGEGAKVPVDLDGYIDGITGKVLYRTNNVKETVNQTVQGDVYKTNPLNPISTEPLANLKVTIGGTDYFTDTAGVLSITTLTAPVTATMRLEGKWSNVVDYGTGVTPSFSNVINASGGNYVFPVTSPSADRHVNAYYHVNRVHDFMKGFFPTFTVMDNPLTTNVDVTTGTCNAFYNGNSINFYAAGGGCNSFAYCGDIIYHEYGHGISRRFYQFMGQGTIINSALNEANSDIWGIGITKDPVLGKGSTPSGGIIRRYDLAPKVYPVDIVGEEHADGEIIAGAWWDVAVNVSSVDTMLRIFTDTYWDTPDGPDGAEGQVYHDVLISALLNDDNDNNLNNGTPHFLEIINAFAKHGIYLLGDATLTHSEIAHQPENAAINISADLMVSTPAFMKNLMLVYRTQGSTQWDSLTMTPQISPTTYSATVPGQTAGTIIEYYFALTDTFSFLNAAYPENYSPALSPLVTTIPYQFGIGLDQKSHIDFDGSVAGWTLGNASGDNADDGLWIADYPVGSYMNGIATSILVQTDADHTNGAGKCLITGNAFFPNSSPGDADVDNGKTSAISPVFDVTGFADPVVEYWRWYTNKGGSNPNQDYWQVFIKDPASPFWLYRVDYTRASDNEWRRRIFRVKQYLPNSQKFVLKFQAEDGAPGSVVEAAVDDIFIYDKSVMTRVDDVDQMKAKVYPNPANSEITITLSSVPKQGYIRLYDLTGKQVATIDLTGKSTYTINTAHIAAGTYFLSIKTEKILQSKTVSVVH